METRKYGRFPGMLQARPPVDCNKDVMQSRHAAISVYRDLYTRVFFLKLRNSRTTLNVSISHTHGLL